LHRFRDGRGCRRLVIDPVLSNSCKALSSTLSYTPRHHYCVIFLDQQDGVDTLLGYNGTLTAAAQLSRLS